MLRDGATPFYFGRVEHEGEIALVFIKVGVLDAFNRSEELHMDGTFLSTPRYFHQLATLHTIAFGYVSRGFCHFPLAYLFIYFLYCIGVSNSFLPNDFKDRGVIPPLS